MAKTTITKILFRRGSDYDRTPTVLDEGEPGWTTDTCRMFIGDGRQTGGFPVVNIRTPSNATKHKYNNDLIYEPLQDVTGITQPPTLEVLAINHPGLSGNMTRDWMDDRFVLKDPCKSNSLKYPPDPAICAPNSGRLPKQIINAHLDVMGDLKVFGHSYFTGGISVSGVADFCEATIKTDDIVSCDSGIINIAVDNRVKIVGKSLAVPTGDASARPTPAIAGDMRFNTEYNRMENYDGYVWTSVGGESKTYYIKDEDVVETVNSSPGSRQLALTTEMLALNVPASDVSKNLPVYVVKVTHNLNQMYPTLIVYDDYRKQVIPDEIWMIDENTCLVNLTSFLDPVGPPQWSLSTSGPGHTVGTGFVPPMYYSLTGAVQTSAPPGDKKWVITIQG